MKPLEASGKAAAGSARQDGGGKANRGESAAFCSSPAKINLFLEVVDKRSDGYHNIESVFCGISLHDTLAAEVADGGEITLECAAPDIPRDERNLAIRAAKALQQRYAVPGGMHFRLEKTIPTGSGLGGGSSNAAAALRLANMLWGVNAPDGELREIAVRIGADVPFFLHGGTCLCRGVGEIITPLAAGLPASVGMGLFLPPIHSDTAAAYRTLRLPPPGRHRPAARFIEALERGDVDAIEEEAFNRFEATVFAALPALARFKTGLEERIGRPARMSGSGSGLWFLLRAGEEIGPDAVRWAEGEGARLERFTVNSDRKPGHFA